MAMRKRRKNDGFSLTEVLLSVGILTVGLVFVAGVFPVGIHFATIGTERTIAAIVTDEALAKIKLYGVDTNDISLWPLNTECADFNDVSAVPLNLSEFAYPSTAEDISDKKFYWSALCRRVDVSTSLVQVTVFVYRKVGAGKKYRNPDDPIRGLSIDYLDYPRPVWIFVSPGNRTNELRILDSDPSPILVDEKTFINDGCTIVDDQTGQKFRVLERYISPDDATILLDRDYMLWPAGPPVPPLPRRVWVVPPPVGGGRNPCIAIYQEEIQF